MDKSKKLGALVENREGRYRISQIRLSIQSQYSIKAQLNIRSLEGQDWLRLILVELPIWRGVLEDGSAASDLCQERM